MLPVLRWGQSNVDEIVAGVKAGHGAAGILLRDDAASPVVIEGYYSGTGGSAEQLRLSRGRAILVRQYLQSRFQLDSNHLRIVPLKGSPPNGIGRTAWNGIC
ncbi:MAG: OmpA family protein, partial [Acidobacteriia bacterium]|nr:OmpA family protein [Terriglobia bacterium]